MPQLICGGPLKELEHFYFYMFVKFTALKFRLLKIETHFMYKGNAIFWRPLDQTRVQNLILMEYLVKMRDKGVKMSLSKS